MMQKHPHLRMCVACREMKDKRALIRIVKSKEGAVSIDRTGRANGRGAYLCLDEGCLTKAKKTRALERAFEKQVPGEVYEMLAEEIGGIEQKKI